MEKEISPECTCQNDPEEKEEIAQNVLPFSPPEKSEDKLTKESIESSNDLKSKKFIAFIVAIVIGMSGFLLVYLKGNDLTAFGKYLDFVLYSLVAYIGGNSVERITNKIGK